MDNVCISYAPPDQTIAHRLAQALRIREHVVTMRSYADDKAETTRLIRNCRAFVPIITPNSVNDDNLTKQLNIANSHGRQVIPAMFTQATVTGASAYHLANTASVSFWETSFDDGVVRLAQALEQPRASRPAGFGFRLGGTPDWGQWAAAGSLILGIITILALCGSSGTAVPLGLITALGGIVLGLNGREASRNLAMAGIALSALPFVMLAAVLILSVLQ